MDYNRLGHSGLRVPALSFGTGTFGGGNDFFKAWGSTDAAGASRLDRHLPRSRREPVRQRRRLFHRPRRADPRRGDQGQAQSPAHLDQGDLSDGRRARTTTARRASISSRRSKDRLRRLGVETIDLLQLHGQDYNTPVEETLSTLDQLVRAGKVRYIGCSNFSGWHLMKSLAVVGPLRLRRAMSRTRPTTRCSTATTSGS